MQRPAQPSQQSPEASSPAVVETPPRKAAVKQSVLRPTKAGTVALMLAYALCCLEAGGTPSEIAQRAAILVLGGLVISVICDLRFGLRNLIRVDLIALMALYFLTFFEFLFHQPAFDTLATPETARTGIIITILGFAGMTVGRHLVKPGARGMRSLQNLKLSPKGFFGLLIVAFFLGNLYMLLAVSFNPVEWINQLMGPRFSQPWQRGKYGSIFTLLNELNLLTYAVPPLCGILWARKRHIGFGFLLIASVLTLTQIFVAFSGGTRNVLAIYLAGFIGGFLLSRPKIKIKEVGLLGAIAGVVFFFASDHMLAFRQMGLRYYVVYEHYKIKADAAEKGGVFTGGYFVDYNLLTITQLAQVFPEPYSYLGFNLPFVAATKPIPRALWPNKPVDLDVGIEEALGARGMTLSCTFVGEAFITGGIPMVLIFGLGFGTLFAWWNRLGATQGSIYSLLTYSSGFFTALTSMRSVMFTTTAMLPVIALICFAKFVAPRLNLSRFKE